MKKMVTILLFALVVNFKFMSTVVFSFVAFTVHNHFAMEISVKIYFNRF